MKEINAILFYNRYIVAVIFAVIVFAIFEWQRFKVLAYSLMLQAKSMAKDMILKSGKEQEDWVVTKAYIFMPKYLAFLPESVVRNAVHYLFVKAKDYLDDGKVNGSVE